MSELVRQTAPIIIEVFFFQGVYLLTPESSAWRRPTASALIVASIVTTILVYGPVGATVVPLPSPLPFAAVAVAASGVAAGLRRYRDRTLLESGALALAERLDDFAQICNAKLGGQFSLPRADRETKEREYHDEYVSTFAREIRRVHRMLTINNEAFADLLDTMLGAGATRAIKQPQLATWTAKTLRLEITLDKPRSIDRRLFLSFGAYVGLAAILWLTLAAIAHKW
jgi:hypothetical protein